MSEAVLVALITGGLAIVGNLITSKSTRTLLAYRIEQLEKKVDAHNNFARRMPVVEEQIKVANNRIKDLEAQK